MNRGVMKNTGIALFFIAFALVYLMGTSRIVSFTPFGSRGMDSKSIPQMLGLLMITLAAIQVAITVQRNKIEMKLAGNREPQPAEEEKALSSDSRKTVFGSIALLVAYVLLYGKLGFVLSTIFYLTSSITLLTPREQRRKMLVYIVPFSVVFSYGIYVIFTKYLTLLLPSGIWG